MMSQNRAEIKQDIAYRALFKEIKELVESDIDLENQIKDVIKDTHEDDAKDRLELALLTKAIKEMVEWDHNNGYKKEINQLAKEVKEIKEMMQDFKNVH